MGQRVSQTISSGSNISSIHRATSADQSRAFNSGATRQHDKAHPLGSFPHANVIESSFGFPIPGSAFVDSQSCSLMGIPAYTSNGATYFATADPPLRVAAHEATHLFQHAGATADVGLGPELHAETVATRVSRQEQVGRLFGRAGHTVVPDVRPFTLIKEAAQEADKWEAGEDLKVADDGNMAAGANIDPHNHDLWAQPSLVSTSNGILVAKKSVIRLKTVGDPLKGPAPDRSGNRTLTRVVPENQANGTSGDAMKIWCDCGRAGRDVMGAGEGTGKNNEQMTADYTKIDRPWYASIPILGRLLSWIFGGEKKEKKQTSASSPAGMKNEIFNEKLGGTGTEGMEKYEHMSPDDKKEFDKETGINRYAAPGVGQGFTMSSGGADLPGNTTWNFHWAGVVMVSGGDRVTLENYATGDPDAQNAEWDFGLYGPPSKTGQTFYDEHKATGQHGTSPTAMQVETR
jgi:hypothetical protein